MESASHAPDPISRRQFVQRTALAAAAVAALPRGTVAAPRRPGPGENLNLAFIGVGGRGASNLAEVTPLAGVTVFALCDVDARTLAQQSEKFPGAKTYRDFRVMLEQEPQLHGVIIAVPDHAHAVIAMAAIKRGVHVYCEKPLAHTIVEARTLAAAAREAGVATQMGNQGMAFEGNRLINEWIADGAIGTVREVHVWSDRPTTRGKLPLKWPQGTERPTDAQATPPELDWDLWLGPAPHRPYHPAWAKFKWRAWFDFGTGGLGDMGVHNLAPVFSALRLTAPVSVHASSTPVIGETYPLASSIHFQFPAREGLPPVKVHWYDGGLLPARPDELEDGRALNPEDGVIFVGDQGKMLVEGWGGRSPRLLPEARMRDYKQPPKTLPRSVGHHQEWLDACRTGSATRSHFDFGALLTEALLLGLISVRLGGIKLNWDSAAMRVTNHPAANALLHYEYRSGWSL